jgi:hypothetical protein
VINITFALPARRDGKAAVDGPQKHHQGTPHEGLIINDQDAHATQIASALRAARATAVDTGCMPTGSRWTVRCRMAASGTDGSQEH